MVVTNELFIPSVSLKTFLDTNLRIIPIYLNFPSKTTTGLSNLELTGIAQYATSNVLEGLLSVVSKNEERYQPGVHNFYWSMAITESIMNAYDHGLGLESGINIALFSGDNGLGFGIHDEGDFYKQEAVKQLLQHKELPSKDNYPSLYKDSDKKAGFRGRHGFEQFYEHADTIEVDTVVGVLYFGFGKERIFTKR